MKKELHPTTEDAACEICGRTILKGERTEIYLAPGGRRHRVCDLCLARADQQGWIRESAHGDMPTTIGRPEPRRSLLGRLKRRHESEPEELPLAAEPPLEAAEPEVEPELEPEAANGEGPAAAPWRPPKDPRHVRAIPTNAEVKVERALELFNSSEHARTVAGIARTLGEPWVSAGPAAEAPSEVSLTVAWELSWYRFRVDLGDEHEPVTLLDKGQELEELPEDARVWNGSAASDGRLHIGVGSQH